IDLIASPWLCLSGPAGLDAATVETLRRTVASAMSTPAFAQISRDEFISLRAFTPAELTAEIVRETEFWRIRLDKKTKP
ncbi:MAG: hypothetical protein ABL907_00355, partial [Hyphomicrobium sp.]